ncbi:MAG: hypothetical protein NTZ11_13530 [Gammaproteobacteria bacterium]|nr:hypothetical protein [Gammaproteobacteria bacterium]
MTQPTPEAFTALISDLHRNASFREAFLTGDLAAAKAAISSRPESASTPYGDLELSDQDVVSLRQTAAKLGKLFGIDLDVVNPMIKNLVILGCPAAGCSCPCKKGIDEPYRSAVRILIPGTEATAFMAVMARMLELCIVTQAAGSVAANIAQALAQVAEASIGNPALTINAGIYLTIGSNPDFFRQQPYLALILSGLAGIASRTGQTGYAAEMNSMLAAVLQP